MLGRLAHLHFFLRIPILYEHAGFFCVLPLHAVPVFRLVVLDDSAIRVHCENF